MAKIKTAKQMERHLKGMANHRRIEILLMLDKNGNMNLGDIVDALAGNEKTIGEHTRRLHLAGLINKKYKARYVDHSLSPYGKRFVQFLKSFQRSQ